MAEEETKQPQQTPAEQEEEETQDPTAGEQAGNEPQGGEEEFTETQQQKVNEIVQGRLAEQERKLTDKFNSEREQLYQSLNRNQQPQEQQPAQDDSKWQNYYSQRIEQLRNKYPEEEDTQLMSRVLASDRQEIAKNMPKLIDKEVRSVRQSESQARTTTKKLKNDDKIGKFVDKYEQEILDYAVSNIPRQQMSEEAIKACAKYVIGGKLAEGELDISTKAQKPPDIPASTPASKKGKQSKAATADEKIIMEQYGMTLEEVRGEESKGKKK